MRSPAQQLASHIAMYFTQIVPDAQLVAMTGSMPGGSMGIPRVMRVFGMKESTSVNYILSPFRPEIQILTINPKLFLSVAASRTRKNVNANYVVENVFRAHVQAILLHSGIIVIATTEGEAQQFIDQYSEICDRTQIGLLLGTRKLSLKRINKLLSDFHKRKISIIVSTSILSMGINLHDFYNIVILGWWSYYELIQYIGRPMRGVNNITSSGLALLFFSPNDFISDIKNAR